MQINAAQVHNPGKARRIIDYDFLGLATGRKGDVTVRNQSGRLVGARF